MIAGFHCNSLFDSHVGSGPRAALPRWQSVTTISIAVNQRAVLIVFWTVSFGVPVLLVLAQGPGVHGSSPVQAFSGYYGGGSRIIGPRLFTIL